jgi:zinc/manganese transport system ATP-binding protein
MDKPKTVIELKDATLKLGGRSLWEHLNLEVKRGEFIAVLGPNGSGKTSLIQILLGLESLASGSVVVDGETPHRGSKVIGYVPQQRAFDDDLPITGRDLVHMGLDGFKFGVSFGDQNARQEVQRVINQVGAAVYADAPIGLLSGGEQQRLRIAQALLGTPKVLLCDEPLLSLDIASQQVVSSLINDHRQKSRAAIVFVTHDINPILPMVDRVLYLVGHRWAVGKPDQVLTSERLSELYGAQIDVIRAKGKILVVGGNELELGEGGHHGRTR